MAKAKKKTKENEFEKFAKRKPELTVLTDHPLTDEHAKKMFDEDPFNFRFKLGPVFDILRYPTTQTPISILISGGWGTGKTSAMKWLDSLITEWKSHAGHDDIKVRSVWFYPWKYDNKEDVRRGIISEVIIKSIDIENVSTRTVISAAKKFGLFLGKSFIHALASIKLKGKVSVGVDETKAEAGADVDLASIKEILTEYQQAAHPEKAYLNEFETTLKDWIQETVGKDGKERMVIFIDDLDRCMPDIALQVLEALKLYLNIPNLIFILGVDKEVVGNLVVEHYKKLGLVKKKEDKESEAEKEKREKVEAKARQYLSKMFQVEIELSPNEDQISHFFEEQLKEIKYWNKKYLSKNEQEIFRELILNFAGRNPREVKRLLNSSLMTGAGAILVKDKIEFRQGMQLFFVRKILDEKYTMASEAGSKRGISFFIQWSQIVCKGLSENKKVPLNVAISEDSKEKISKILHESYGISQKKEINDSEVVENYLNEALFSKEDFSSIPSEYHTILKDKDNLVLLHLLSDIDLGKLMQIPYPEEAAEVVAVVGTTKDDEIIREAVARELDKAPSQLTNADYEKVTLLDLSFSSFKNIKLLENLKNLKILVLYETQIDDIGSLSSLTNLQELHLDGTLISKVDALARLTKLQNLTLAQTNIVEVDSLAGLTDLHGLNLNGTDVSDIRPLEGLVNLKWLFLSLTKITDINPLRELTKLQQLHLLSTQIADLEPLYELKNVQELMLTGTSVSDIGALSGLTNLQKLYLTRTSVSDLSALSGLTNLQELDLGNTSVSDLSALSGLTNLQRLFLQNCKNITDKQIEDLKKALPSLKIY